MNMATMLGNSFPNMIVPPRPDGMSRPLAMAYIQPQQQISNVFSAIDGLRVGALFPELYKPFLGRQGDH